MVGHRPQADKAKRPLALSACVFARPAIAPALVAVLTFFAVTLTLDPAGNYPEMPQGPGLTIDESFNVRVGVYLTRAMQAYGLGLLDPGAWIEIYGQPGYNPDHPPLGRILLGISHEVCMAIAPPAVGTQAGGPQQVVATVCARAGSAALFAGTVFLVGLYAGRWYGRHAGLWAALSLPLMPRLFGHAHLASLETATGFFWVLFVLVVADRMAGKERVAASTAALAGFLWGLLLLTKIQAVLVPVPLALWMLWNWRARALLPGLIVAAVGLATFLAGWPWLWINPLSHFGEYFGRSTDRVVLHVWYFGERYADREVPAFYPLVHFLITVPLGLHLLGALGAWRGRQLLGDAAPVLDVQRRRELLLALMIGFPLLFFALPGITVYDGARLFLVVFPLWGVFVGAGTAWLTDELPRRWPTLARRRDVAIIALLFAAQAWGVVRLHPCQLSYYNALVGGLRGAAALGMEQDYWGAAVTRELLEEMRGRIDEGATIHVAPVLHQFQLEELQAQSPIVARAGWRLEPFDGEMDGVRYLLMFHRLANRWPELTDENLPEPLAVTQRAGVILAAVYKRE